MLSQVLIASRQAKARTDSEVVLMSRLINLLKMGYYFLLHDVFDVILYNNVFLVLFLLQLFPSRFVISITYA
jgi:hypothetical protein